VTDTVQKFLESKRPLTAFLSEEGEMHLEEEGNGGEGEGEGCSSAYRQHQG